MDIIFKYFIFCFLFLSMLLGCTNLIYQGDRFLYATPQKFGIESKEFFVSSPDGTKLMGWELKSSTPNPDTLILMFHGNAQNISSHFFNLAWITKNKTDLIIFDYRGYGLSEGSPYPRGMMEDGVAFLEFAHHKFIEGKYKKLIVYGQSLGGSILLRSLEEIKWSQDISLLVLDSTFRSPQDVAKTKLFGLFWWLISSAYTSDPKLLNLTMPLLVIHSIHDKTVPYRFGQLLYDTAPSKIKSFWKLDEADAYHGNVFFINNGIYRDKFLKFLNH